jgi:hypothetical protein
MRIRVSIQFKISHLSHVLEQGNQMDWIPS